jgi:hypothetical protein
MPDSKRLRTVLGIAAILLFSSSGSQQSTKDPIPSQFTQEQRENLMRFLQEHEKPDRFIPPGAKVVSSQPASIELREEQPTGKPVKQYMVQITPHRPVPGQEEVTRAEVYYYRPNPEKGKPGITVRHTVDLNTGKQVGPTEVLLNSHTPVSRAEVAQAAELAREKSAAVQQLYKVRDKSTVHWEYLQLIINRKHGIHEPGDRVVRLVFTAPALKDQETPAPVAVIVNLTKDIVGSDEPSKGNQ